MKKKIFIVFLIFCLLAALVFLLFGHKKSQKPKDDKTATTEEPEETIDQKIDDMIDDMTLEEKVGQMFIVRCPNSPDDVSAIKEYNLGSYILFAKDFEDYSVEQIQSHIKTYQSNAKIPMFIGVDEEGGTVNRISCYSQFRSTPFKSPRDLFAQGGQEAINSDAEEKCQLLKKLGVNLNFAPVCDISTNTTDFMYYRSLGQDPETTGQYAKSLVQIGNENNVGSILKHFPGYGNNADTHTGIAYDNRDYSTFEKQDFIPFKEGITGGSCGILVSHNIVKCMDSKMPASLSSAVHKIIRNEIGFDGVIITDDLSMGAIQQFTGADTAAVTAVKAGNDMLCCDDYVDQVPAVIDACNKGQIDEKQIDESVHRILLWKNQLGLLEL